MSRRKKKDIPTIDEYIKERLKILKDFYIVPTEEEISHLKTMKTEIGVDVAMRKIIKNHFN